ncbi:ferrous iron transport protein A, partial [Klebsiella pneumoniae]
MIRFTDLKPGDKAIIVQAEPDCDFCRRLMEMGLVVGTEVKVVKV